jgi:general secretion pathway protein G
MSKKAGMRRQAFTLVELLVVVIIIAILAAIAIPKFTNASLRSKESSLKGELKLLRDAVANYDADTTGYPAQITDLMATTAPTNCYSPTASALMSIAANTWHGPYIANIDNDPISNTAFTYTYTTGVVQPSSSDPEPASDGSNYQNW